jgi:hypothetical protein
MTFKITIEFKIIIINFNLLIILKGTSQLVRKTLKNHLAFPFFF